MKPKVTIIIPVYNVESFLPRCLDSVVGQTLRDIEAVCVDDGSSDGSLEILKRYAARDSRIRVIAQKNGGAGSARNRGCEVARGEFIAFLDSDDWIDDAYCERLYAVACETGAEAAFASIQKIRPAYAKWVLHFEKQELLTDPQERFDRFDCPPSCFITNCIIRRDWVERKQLRFTEHVCYEDVEFAMRVYAETERVVTVPGVAYRYMLNVNSITKGKTTLKKQQDRYRAHKALVAYADAHGIAVSRKFRNITLRDYCRWGISWLKIRERGEVRSYRLFDFIPVWYKRVTDN